MKIPEKREDITLPWLKSIFIPHGITVHRFKLNGETGIGRGFMGALEQVDLEITRLSKPDAPTALLSGTDYLGVHEEIEVSPSTTEMLHVVLKTLPNDEFRRSYAANDGFSSREVSMYSEVFPAWEKFLDSRQVPPANRFRFPFCYYGAEEGQGETYKYILVLENLTALESPFHLWTGGFNDPLPWLAASAVIRQIARFHATGIAFKIENRVNYYKLFPKLHHIISPMFQIMWDMGFETVKEIIDASVDKHEIPDKLFESIDTLRTDSSRDLLLRWFTDPTVFTESEDKATATSTILHNDLHSYNLVLRDEGEGVRDAILFDYQACCVFNPMKDLSFFLILNCQSEDYSENLPRTLEVYHDEFEKTMTAIGTDFNYTVESITKDYHWYLAFSIAHILTGAPIWVNGKDSTVKSKRRFAMAVIDAYKKGILKFPKHFP